MDEQHECKFQCILDDNWFKTIKDNHWERFFECTKKKSLRCTHSISFGYTLYICNCPLGNALVGTVRVPKEDIMNPLRVALVVSDDEEIRECFSRMFKKIGISFLFESQKTQALIRLLEIQVGVVIADMTLFEDNGIDFLRLVKRIRPRVPLIAITPDPSEESRNRVLDAGAMFCIVKPVQEEAFAEMVGNLWENE